MNNTPKISIFSGIEKRVSILLLAILSFVNMYSNSLLHENRQLTNREVTNLTALSKAYGYIRYFYPNPLLKEFDWYKFLYYAQPKIVDCTSNKLLAKELTELFTPLCREVKFSTDSVNLTQPLTAPYYIMEHKAIGSLISREYKKNYTPFRYLETGLPGLKYQDSYTYSLANGLFMTFPLAIHKLPGTSKELDILKLRLTKTTLKTTGLIKAIFHGVKDSYTLFDYLYMRTADLMIRQNVVQHFYPYYTEDTLQTRWPKACEQAFRVVASAETTGAYFDALKALHACVNDSHMQLYNTFMISEKMGAWFQTFSDDISVKFCGDTCYVDTVGTKFSGQAIHGDIVLSINDRPIHDVIKEKLELTIASTDANRLIRVEPFQTYKADSIMKVEIKKLMGV